jgi:hypothetical protein
MMAKNPMDLYQEHFVDKDFERLDLFHLLRERFAIRRAIYPGSFVHITPSFVISDTAYVEMDKRAKKFFENSELKEFVSSRKDYSGEAKIAFYAQDYQKKIAGEDERYDLLISQYAGFISKHCKRYLKIGGLLLVNNSHGDASMASINDSYRLIAVVLKSGSKHRVSEKNLAEYFVPKKEVDVTEEYLEEIQKGIGYKKTASSYIFQRVS